MREVSGYNGDEPALNCLIRGKVMTTMLEAVFENEVFNRNALGRYRRLSRIRMGLFD